MFIVEDITVQYSNIKSRGKMCNPEDGSSTLSETLVTTYKIAVSQSIRPQSTSFPVFGTNSYYNTRSPPSPF
jgi:hypothetical protein